LELLRHDYVGRLSGMLKAIAAVDRRHATGSEILAQLEALPGCSTEQLIEQYRRVSARFRDTFPASFGMVRPAPTTFEQAQLRKGSKQ
jgi:hypothetical protein